MPKISVILPFFNSEKTIVTSVKSILDQSFRDFELILINNNSNDNSKKIVHHLLKTDNRIKLINEKKQGVVYASKKGLDHASSEFIARADADDTWHQDKLKLQYNYLKANPNIDVVSCCVNFDGDESKRGMIRYVEETNEKRSHIEISLNRFSELQVINPTILFKKELALKYGFYEEGDFPEDYEMFLRWLDNGVKFHKLPDKLLNWYDHPERLTRTDKRYSFDAFYRTKVKYLSKWLRKHNIYNHRVIIWGAGSSSVKRANMLIQEGIKIISYIDVDKKKALKENVMYYKELPEAGDFFIVSYVNNQGARKEIREFLIQKKYIEGKDFIIA